MSEPGVRLSKRMTELGLCSRREADDFIERGLVRVDGAVVRVLGSRVLPEQKIELIRQATLPSESRVTLLLYKPEQTAQALPKFIRAETRSPDDNSGIEFLPRHAGKLSLAGALDHAASGLVAMTQDGRLAEKIAERELEYLVQVDSAPPADELQKRLQAVRLDGAVVPPFKVTRQSDRQLRFVLHRPLPRQIWLLCEQAGIAIGSVRCIRIGSISTGSLQPGQWRYLQAFEQF
ncbi:S4 domain-containing protein [Paludibacterium yongneupense]|uniref:S4 domain-containing protein n=1 Tax=Paludibacterium yongneupense TaxID=400061 RepID=UPI000407D49B|nr:S4 domain-containing protein [Paludibacterium yongneupense]